MRVHFILCIASQLISGTSANTEKVIFIAPTTAGRSTPGLKDVCVPVLTPAEPALYAQLSVPSVDHTPAVSRTSESWYLLGELDEGQRYELRVCWAATQPTEFWLDTVTVSELASDAGLQASIATYSKQRPPELCAESERAITTKSSLLLRVRAAADFFSTNQTLMREPLDVGVDIILDPYLFNVLPRSLLNVVAIIAVVGIGAWVLSGMTWRTLESIVDASRNKHHAE